MTDTLGHQRPSGLEGEGPMDPNEVHTITRGQIEHILTCLKAIDRARTQLSKGPDNHTLIRELANYTDGISRLVKKLPKAAASR